MQNRYYDTEKKRQVSFRGNNPPQNLIKDDDKRVVNFFEPTPYGYYKEYTEDGLPFNKQVSVKTDAEIKTEQIAIKVSEEKAYLAKTDFKMTIDYYDTMSTEEQLDLVTLRATARAFVIANEV